MTDVIVVGGGVAGLVAARRLALAKRSVAIVEASDRLGGSVARHIVGGIALDAGAESFATRKGTVAALATELGLGGEIVTPDREGGWLFPATGAPHPLPATSLLGIPGSPLAADVISVIGAGAAARAILDSLLPGVVGANARTLGELVRIRMGRAVVDQLVGPIAHGVHSTHPDALEVDRVAPGLRAALRREGSLSRAVRDLRAAGPAGSAVAGIRGGMARLVDELVADIERLGVDVRLGVPAESVDHTSVRVGDTELRGQVVVAAPGLVGERADGPLITLATLVLDAPGLANAPRGTGVLVAAGATNVRARALTHSTAKWQWLAERSDGREVVRLSFDDEPADLKATSIADASTLLGVALTDSNVVDFARAQWRRPAPRRASEGYAQTGIVEVGEAVAGSGLANVIAHAESTIEDYLRDDDA